MVRSSVIECAMDVALSMANRSEDPWTKVGAVALTEDNRFIATAYNGLLPGYEMSTLFDFIRPDNYPSNLQDETVRDLRLPFVVHCEQNLCSLIRRYEAVHCVITVCPCPSCMILLAIHGIKKVTYLQEYLRDSTANKIAKFYHLELVKYSGPCKTRVSEKVLE
jgi:dCMP deaminase